MIYSLNGLVADKLNDSAVIVCGGVGFRVQMTRRGIGSLADIGQNCFVFVNMIVREDAMELYGFTDSDERDCFKTLLSVSGIGPKAATAVLSELSPQELSAAVATGDTALITRAQGVGPKVAQRIVLELKDKLKGIAPAQIKSAPARQGDASKTIEAIDALMSLGYTQHEAKRAISSMDISSMTVEDIIKVALKQMM